MNEIKRWECRVATNANGRPYVDDIEFAAGRYVLHTDHEAEVARLHDLIDDKDEIIARQDRLLVERQGSNDRLRAEVEKVRGYEVAALGEKVAELRAELQNAAKAALDAVALACEKEREADALWLDAERYRWLRDGAPDEWSVLLWVDSNSQLLIDDSLMDSKIDAAMQEQAE